MCISPIGETCCFTSHGETEKKGRIISFFSNTFSPLLLHRAILFATTGVQSSKTNTKLSTAVKWLKWRTSCWLPSTFRVGNCLRHYQKLTGLIEPDTIWIFAFLVRLYQPHAFESDKALADNLHPSNPTAPSPGISGSERSSITTVPHQPCGKNFAYLSTCFFSLLLIWGFIFKEQNWEWLMPVISHWNWGMIYYLLWPSCQLHPQRPCFL